MLICTSLAWPIRFRCKRRVVCPPASDLAKEAQRRKEHTTPPRPSVCSAPLNCFPMPADCDGANDKRAAPAQTPPSIVCSPFERSLQSLKRSLNFQEISRYTTNRRAAIHCVCAGASLLNGSLELLVVSTTHDALCTTQGKQRRQEPVRQNDDNDNNGWRCDATTTRSVQHHTVRVIFQSSGQTTNLAHLN